MPGLPQSATGQTAIFTGQNAAMAIGRHLNATVAGLAAGIHVFRSLDDVRAGEAVGFDIDHQVMRAMGIDLEPVDPVEVGRRAARVAARHHFTLYEHFLTDKAGHAQDYAEAVRVLERVDRFLQGVLAELPADLLLVIASDHGNIENLSVRTHTLNPVLTIVKGPRPRCWPPALKA